MFLKIIRPVLALPPKTSEVVNSLNPSSKLDENVSSLDKALTPISGHSTLGSVISQIYSVAIILATLIVFIYFIWGGFDWLTAGGESDKISKAQKKITGAIIGFVVVLAAWALWRLTLDIGGLSSFFPINKR